MGKYGINYNVGKCLIYLKEVLVVKHFLIQLQCLMIKDLLEII